MAVSLYTKLHRSILGSSIWFEPATTVKVWVCLLALADETGHVFISPRGLLQTAAVSKQELDAAIGTLSAPDIDSTSPAEDGRRIVKVQGGWFLVNHAQYRGKETDRKVAAAERQKRYRDKQRLCAESGSRDVTRDASDVTRDAVSHEGCSHLPKIKTKTKTETETEIKTLRGNCADDDDIAATLTPASRKSPAKRGTKKPPPSQALGVAQFLYDSIRSHDIGFMAKAKPAVIEKELYGWAVDLDRAERLDGKPYQEQEACIAYVHRSNDGAWWRSKVLSGKKLRKHFATLSMQAKGSDGIKRGPHSQTGIPDHVAFADTVFFGGGE